jgi:chromosome segregation ATPase
MTDIVERLREAKMCQGTPCRIKDAQSGCECAEAADEIERLRKENAELGEEVCEQARLNGMGSEREAKLLGEIERLRAGHARLCDKLGERCDEIERLKAKVTQLLEISAAEMRKRDDEIELLREKIDEQEEDRCTKCRLLMAAVRLAPCPHDDCPSLLMSKEGGRDR